MPFDGTILALDLATRTGVAQGAPGGVPTLETINFSCEDGIEDLYGRAVFWIAERLRKDPPTLVVIERIVPPSAAYGHTNHDTTMLTIGLFGIMCGVVRCKRIPIMTAPIKTWRKHFLGRGDYPGDVAKTKAKKLCRTLGWSAPDHNAAEAAGIWSWGCVQVVQEKAGTFSGRFRMAML